MCCSLHIFQSLNIPDQLVIDRPLDSDPERSLCVQTHPNVVFTEPAGTDETCVQRRARTHLASFDVLLASMAATARCTPGRPGNVKATWHADWVAYLEAFAAWKLKDAAVLEVTSTNPTCLPCWFCRNWAVV